MIEFLNPEVELRFHSLPVEKQREWQDMADRYLKKGCVLKILFVDQSEQGLEVSIRVDKKFDV